MVQYTRVGIVALFCFLTLCACDRLHSVDSIVSRGEAQLEKGNYRAAVGDFKTALERDAANNKARFGLAQALHHLADFEGAQYSIDAAVTSGLNDRSAVAFKYEVMLSRRAYEAIVKEAAIDSRLDDKDRAFILGKAYMGLGKRDEASQSLAKAVELERAIGKVEPKMLVAQAELYASLGRTDEAKTLLETVLHDDAANAPAWMVDAGLHIAKADWAQAKKSLEIAEKNSPRQLNWNEQARLEAALADVCIRLNDAECAAHAIDVLNHRAPQSVLSYYMQARLAVLKNNLNDAVAQLQKALQGNDDLPSQLLLANVQMMQGNYGQAQTQLDKILSAHPDNQDARTMLAQLYLATNRPVDARKMLPTPTEATESPQMDWLRGQTMMASGSFEEGIALLEKSVAANKSDTQHALQLARAYISSGMRDKAIALLESLPADAGGAQRQGLLVIANVMGKSATEMQKSINGLLERYPKDSYLHAASGAVLARAGDVDRAIALMTQAVTLDGANADARIALSSLLFASGKPQDAEQQLKSVIASDAKSVTAHIALAKLQLSTGRKDQAVAQLEQAIGARPEAIEPRIYLAQIALVDKDFKRAKGLLDQAVATAKSSPAAFNAAGTMMFQARQNEDALAYFEQAAVAGNALGKLNAARVQLILGKKNDARVRLGSIANEDSVRFPAAALLAQLDVEEGKLDSALARTEKLRPASPSPDIDELQGDLCATAKKFDQALSLYDRALQKKPTQQLTLKKYRVLELSDDSKGAGAKSQAVLTNWLARTPNDAVVRKQLASHYLRHKNSAAAAKEFELLLTNSKMRDPEVLNDLAWIYGELNDPRALATAKEAYEARPGSPEIADTYAWLLLGKNQAADALPILEKAAQKAQDNPEIQYHYAAAQLRSGDRQRAQRLLQETLEKHKQFPSRDAAQHLLQSIH